jgi:gas vesicle protein
MGGFKRGIFLGGLLGAGFAWLTFTKEGRKMRDEGLDHAVKVYAQVKKEVKKSPTWKKMTKSDFARLVEKITTDYASEIGLAKKATSMIVALVVNQWEKMKKEMN